MAGDRLRLRFFPPAATVLLDVPGVRAYVTEEGRAFFLVGDEIDIGEMRIVVDQHLADVEDDVADIAHGFLCAFVAPG